MKAIRFTINILITTIVIVTLAVAAQAQTRVFVSGTGDDLNPCTRTSPCRNFQRGHDAVAAGGEVVALDSAGYGQLTITKSVTITGDGLYAGITASSGNGITIATAGVTVNLRSLTIEGLGSGVRGIHATHFTALHIENCIVSGFTSDGIRGQATVAAVTSKVFIKDSISRNNALVGIFLINGGGTGLIASVEGTRAENNTDGILFSGVNATGTARDCLAASNTFAGLRSESAAVLNIESCVTSNNAYGIHVASATGRVSNSTVTDNTAFGFFNDTGTFESRGNNTVAGNNGGGAQTSGTITPLAAL